MKIPLAETFQAVWGNGGTTIEESAKNMWPVYPPSYSKQLDSMMEAGKGDTIHPNALGHLAMARAVFAAMTGNITPAPLRMTGISEWTEAGVVSRVTVQNQSGTRREGTLAVYPVGGDVKLEGDGRYALEPGQQIQLTVSWPAARKPEDLLKNPSDMDLSMNEPQVPVVDFSAKTSRVYAAAAPFAPAGGFVRDRQVTTDRNVKIGLMEDGKRRDIAVSIPANAEVGRIPLLEKIQGGGKIGWAAAEVAYVRFGAAKAGEATVDGNLDEWTDQTWVPVGEACQARWTRGLADSRANPQECYLRWAFKAGKDGLFIAVKGTGQMDKDNFTLFFDTRSPKELGTAGPYYWASGAFKPDGKLVLGKGETSAKATGMAGAWKSQDGGASIEMFIPYELMELAAWPASGDLGLSIWWKHAGANGSTNLMWSEDGHPWNTCWYGVVRLMNAPRGELPYMVRVR